MNSRVLFAALLIGLSISTAACGSVPVIYCTDLFHPHEDPDDHFDLATIFSLPKLDLRAIILDQGKRQQQRPGSIPIAQIMQITGRRVPTAIGLAQPLTHPGDQSLNQPEAYQQGVQLILQTLRDSPEPIQIATVGSVRDVAAALNREPELCHRKISRLLIFIGEASNPTFREYNVGLDLHAYVGLMRSNLPIWWVPCFDGGAWQNHGHASYWKASHRDLLQNVSPPLLQYFVYALQKPEVDPLSFLTQPVNPQQREQLLAGHRNLWCTTIFEVLTWPVDKTENAVFGFRPIKIQIQDDGVIVDQTNDRSDAATHTVMQFEIRDRDAYAEFMTKATAEQLSRLGAD